LSQVIAAGVSMDTATVADVGPKASSLRVFDIVFRSENMFCFDTDLLSMRQRATTMVISRRLTWIQAMRFVAALLVVMHHTTSLFWLLSFDMGHYGVLLFFTISGYVITGLLHTDYRKYIAHRILRIYPAYVGSFVIAALILGAFQVVPFKEMHHLKWSMSLLPLGGEISQWSRVPYWTLLYEIVFYAVIYLFIVVGPKYFNLFLVLWAALIVARNLVAPVTEYQFQTANLWTIFTSHLSLCFVIGAALERLHRTGATWPLATILVAAFLPETGYARETAGFGVLFAALIHMSVLLEQHIKAPTALIWLGDRSYGLYLLHNPGIAFLLVIPIFGIMPLWANVTLLTIGSALIGIAYGHLEFSFYVWSRRKVDDRLKRRFLATSAAKARMSSGIA
jgi:exopolysaccharide production protein ExoZ